MAPKVRLRHFVERAARSSLALPTQNEWAEFRTFVEQLADGDVPLEEVAYHAQCLLEIWGERPPRFPTPPILSEEGRTSAV